MTVPRRPRAPWYSGATRRISLVRVGLPTLVACVIAMSPAAAAAAPAEVGMAATTVVHTTQSAASALVGHPDGHRGHGHGPDGDTASREDGR
jgi:hypothetical protein